MFGCHFSFLTTKTFTMKHFNKLFIIFLIFCQKLGYSQSPDWSSVKSIDANSGSSSHVAIDPSGNVYVACGFNTATIFVGSIMLTNAAAGSDDILIVKYDASGNMLWAKSAGGNSTDLPMGIATDVYGNVYITGYFKSPNISFGSTILTNAGNNEFYIVKYDAAGNSQWAKRAGGILRDEGRAITTDASGNVYVTGMFFSSTINFGSTTLINTNNTGSGDAFTVKYDITGNVVWAKSSGGNAEEGPEAICVDANGNVFITGYFNSNPANFGAISLLKAGSITDMFIVKYDALGNVLWAKNSLGSHNSAQGSGIVIDVSGNICVAGGFIGSVNFGATFLTTAGGTDIFLVKFDATGNEIWAKSSGASNHESASDLSSDANGNLYITGSFLSSSISFGSSVLLNASSSSDFFVACYNSTGDAIWGKNAGGNLADVGYSIVTGFSGKVYITGGFASSSITFGGTTLTPPGIFIVTIGNCPDVNSE